MNIQAVAQVIRSIGWLSEDYTGHVARARATLASGSAAPAVADVARRIVAAADSDATPPAPAPAVPAQAPCAPASDESDILLGLDGAGNRLTVAGCRATGKAPLDYLTAAGVQLSAVGRRVLADLQDLRAQSPETRALLARAQELKIDVERIRAFAAAHNIDFLAALKGEVTFQEQLAADLERIGPQGGA